MNPDEFIQDPWKDKSVHPAYKNSFMHMRPAPEYASGEVVLASVYRNVGFSDSVSEGKVPALGRDFSRRLERGSRLRATNDSGISIETWRMILSGALASPKQPNQSTKRFLQICPLLPDAAIYSLSARLSANSWNPGELVSMLIRFGAADGASAKEKWSSLFQGLTVTDDDDIWARILQDEFLVWRTSALSCEWNEQPLTPSPIAENWHVGEGVIPAQQFVRDLEHVLSLKGKLTRRQWISLLESILRLGTASHILWLCRANAECLKILETVLEGALPPAEDDIRLRLSVGDPFWRYGQLAAKTIKDFTREFVIARTGLNLILWHCQELHDSGVFEIGDSCFTSIPSIARFARSLASVSSNFPLAQYKQNHQKAIEEDPRVVACKRGISSNISEFLRHVLGQRQTSESGMESYDQGYYLRKRGNYSQAPWIFSLGPVAVLATVHCCTNGAKGPRTVEDLCRHLAKYGIEVRAQDVPLSDLGQTLRNLGLVLDSPDAEGGMVLVNPFTSVTDGE
jgi:hypothetical protein